MKDKLYKTNIPKIYMLLVLLVNVIILVGYFSYAMFTVSVEKKNAINIVTGGLISTIRIDNENKDTMEVPANTMMLYKVELTNTNPIDAKFNLYYAGDLAEGVTIGYIERSGKNIPPDENGVILEAESQEVYFVRVYNETSDTQTITLKSDTGLVNNELPLSQGSHTIGAYAKTTLSDYVLADTSNNINTGDPDQTFITGETPNNYVWYSGKMWRVVSIDSEDDSVKIITQWNISSIPYNEANNTAFSGSFMEQWLNDTTVDGFLGNLREPEKFIKMDSQWNATLTTDVTKLTPTTMSTKAVGLLNIYEYTMSYNGTTSDVGYLNNGLYWRLISPYSTTNIWSILSTGGPVNVASTVALGIRPVVNLKSTNIIAKGDGTSTNPYRLEKDNDTPDNTSPLTTRYSGEYIRFGTGENNLYQIVSRENGKGVKITSAQALKNAGTFVGINYGASVTYSSSITIGSFLNTDYLNTANGYLTADQLLMIDNTGTWYSGVVSTGESYKLAKYTDTNMSETTTPTTASVGLLRLGEQLAGQFDHRNNNTNYWLLTPYTTAQMWYPSVDSNVGQTGITVQRSIRPALYLKASTLISSGTGTKEDPFEIYLQSFTVSKDTVTGGSISLSTTSAKSGTTVSFTTSPSTGYQYNGATVKTSGGTTVATLTSSQKSFTMPEANVVITPKWSKVSYAISKRSVTGGSVSASSTGTYGSTISFTTSPSSGFSYAGATIRNSSGTVLQTLDNSTKSFTMPAQAVTISPKWKKDDYTVLFLDNISACTWSSTNSDGFVMTFAYNSSRTYFYFSCSSTSNARLDAYSNCTFDLTHYQTLRVGAYEHGGSGSKHVTMHIGVSQSRSTWVHQLSNHATISGNGNMVLVYPSIDITNLTGNYYIGFQTLTNSQVVGVDVVDIRLYGRTYE